MSRTVEDITYDLHEVCQLLDVADGIIREMPRPEPIASTLDQLQAIARIARRELDKLTEELGKVD